MTRDVLNWFEIPVRDLERAQRFYETLLGRPMRREPMGPQVLSVFTYDEGRPGGALLSGPEVAPPSREGTVVYLDASPSLDAALERAATLGAKLLCPKITLPDGMGAFAHIEDSEGNRVGLHAV
jgi:predicted enzyme related to lactoylglutathione lyase